MNAVKNVEVVTVPELQNVIETIITCQAVSVDMNTVPDMNKTGNPYYGRIRKIATVNGLIGFNYADAVNNQAEREGKVINFVSQPRKWGTLVGNLVHHKGKVYLQLKVQSLTQIKNRLDVLVNKYGVSIEDMNDFLATADDTKVLYLCDGMPIDKATLEPWLVKKASKPRTQDEIDKAVIVRDVELVNITGMRMLARSFAVVTEVTEQGKDIAEVPATVKVPETV